MSNFDPNVGDGVTRNPFHPAAERIFATNFDDLKFFVDEKEYPAELVIGAHPDVDTLLIMEKDNTAKGEFVMAGSNPWPKMIGVNGSVKIVGTAKSCNCPMGKFKTAGWWKTLMTYKAAVKAD